MSPKKKSRATSAIATDSFPAEITIRPVPVLPKRKTPVGYVAACRTHNWSTAIMCDEISFDPKAIIETGYEAAKRLLNEHIATHHIPLPYGTRLEEGAT